MPCNFFRNQSIHMESHLSADLLLFAPILFSSIGRVLCGWFEGRLSCTLERRCGPPCQPQKSPVFPCGLNLRTCTMIALEKVFVHGVNTLYAPRPSVCEHCPCLWKLAQPVDMRFQLRTPAAVIVPGRRRKVPHPKVLMQFHRFISWCL